MSGPQDPLFQALLKRQAAPQGEVPLPESIPGQEPRMIDNVFDFGLNSLGLTNRKSTAGRLGSVFGAAAPFLPFGKMKAAVSALKGVETAAPAVEATVPSLLERVFASNPEAKGAYDKMLTASLPDVMAQRQAGNAAKYSTNAGAHDALMDLQYADRPRLIPTETGMSYAVPTDAAQSQTVSAGANPSLKTKRTLQTRMDKTGLTEEMIRDIRKLGTKAAMAKYTTMDPRSLAEIVRGGTYGSIK